MQWFKITIRGQDYWIQASDKEAALEMLRGMDLSTISSNIMGGESGFMGEGEQPDVTFTLDDLGPVDKPPDDISKSRILNDLGTNLVGFGRGVGPQQAERIEADRPEFGQFQRGFLEGLGRDPDQSISNVFRRYFQDVQAPGYASTFFKGLLDPGLSQELGVGYQAPTTLQRAADMARSGSNVFGTARNVWSELVNKMSQGFDPNMEPIGPEGTTLREYAGPLTGEADWKQRQELYNLASGAALDKYGRSLGRRILPGMKNIEAQFGTASPEAREAGWLKYLQNKLGLY